MMTTQIQSLPASYPAPPPGGGGQAGAEEDLPPGTTQGLSSSKHESIQRSMSRYHRKRPNKSGHPSSPQLSQQTVRPPGISRFDMATLATLTGEPCPNDQALISSSPRKTAPSYPPQHSSSKNVFSPSEATTTPFTPPLLSPLSLESSREPRQLSRAALFDAIAGARGEAPQSFTKQEDCQMRQLRAQQAAQSEAPLEGGRSVATRRTNHQAETGAVADGAVADEKQKAVYPHQERLKHVLKLWQGGWQLNAGKKEIAKKNGSYDLRRGNSIRQKRATSTREKETLTHSRPESDIPSSQPASSINLLPSTWVDVPVSKPLAQESAKIGPRQWVDAPVSRPTPHTQAAVTLPQYDAPVSAVNAGERHVSVKSHNLSVDLPVTPDTTPEDLMDSASKAMGGAIDPNRSKLVESFTQLGLERPLRNYEHIRDVMNSWDYDKQNSFMIIPAEKDGQFDELDPRNAPKQQPADTSLYMYHSQRPGVWDKRWITLRSDGQVTMSKRQGQEASNICHLTDYDIYVPTYWQQAKRIKPPRKICFAIKSQQKSSMFLNGANFVHFFATKDKATAREWYKAVQGWRSWYLVNILGEGQKSKRGSNNDCIGRTASRSRRRSSINTASSQLSPLLDFNLGDLKFGDSAPSPEATKSAETFYARKMARRGRAPPPTAFPNFSRDGESGPPTRSLHTTPALGKEAGPEEMGSATFAPTGLLGRTYSQRQRPQREAETGRTNSMTSMKSPSIKLPPASISHKPSTTSMRQMPKKPLIDLTPEFKEPPQHTQKGKGVAGIPGRKLVAAATGPNLAIVTPSATAWERPQQPLPTPETMGRVVRPRSPTVDAGKPGILTDGGRLGPSLDARWPQVAGSEPFIDGGLLTRSLSKRARGRSGTGHGVMTGDRNATGQPMVNLQIKSHFVDGSLLRQIEAHTGGDAPVIDREKRQEESVRMGEGV